MTKNTLKSIKTTGLLFISTIGLLYVFYVFTKTQNQQNDEAIHLAKTIAASLHIDQIKKLDANISDLEKPEYKELKSILNNTIKINKQTKFAFFNTRFSYLYTIKNGKIVIYCDSELPESNDYTPPGFVSKNSNPYFFDIFKNQKSSSQFTTNTYGESWISIIIPLIDPQTQKTIAVFEMDFEYTKWFIPILTNSLEALIMVLASIAIFLFFIKIKQKNLLLKQKIEDLEKTDHNLKESEAKLSKVLKNTQDVLFKTKIDGTILEVDDRISNFINYTVEELKGRNINDFYANPADREVLLEILKKNGTVKDYELIMRPENNTLKYVLLNSTLIFDQNNQPLFMEGALKDITERRIAEEKLIESENFLKAIINNQPECIRIVDEQGRLLMMNPSGLEMIEADSFEQVCGNNVLDLVDPEHRDSFLKMHKKVISGGVDKLEFEINGLKGTKRYMETFAVPMEYQGKIVHLAHTRDISDRKKAEMLLKENEQFLKETQKAGHIGSYSFDITNDTWYASEVMNEIFGIDENYAKTAESWLDCIHPEWQKIMADYLMGEVIGQKKNFDKEYKIVRKNDGAERWVHGLGKLHFNSEGYPQKMIGVIQDITDRKNSEKELIKAKEQAEESERLKTAFLANMSHEIRTPMNGILGFTELLKEPNLTGEQQTEYINIIRKSGNRMLNIINDIIDISKIESGLMKVNQTETNINDQLDYMYSFFRHEANHQGIDLIYNKDLPFEKAFINTDKEKIINILTNLIKNAIKFTTKGGIEFGYKLKTATAEKNQVLEFYVKDSGIGIDNTQQDIVFDRFRQSSESTSKNYEGAGLGLAITKSFVEMLGGTIWLESELGKGSTFFFTLPYNPKPKTENTPVIQHSKIETSTTCDLKILIAEDDEISGKLLEIATKQIGKTILRARNGEEAVDLAKNNPDIDLILMDIQMPKMDGYQATAEIRKFNPQVIILAQTAFAFAEDVEKAIDAGCNGHISKPVKKVELIKMVDKFFKDRILNN